MRKVLLDIKKRIPLSNYITAMEKEKKYFITFVYFIIICNKNKKVNILCKKNNNSVIIKSTKNVCLDTLETMG